MKGKLFYKNTNGSLIEYGVIGKPTCLTYQDGKTAHVGDIVKIIHSHNKKPSEYAFICDNERYKSFVMGLACNSSNNVRMGVVDREFKIELVRKYTTLRNNEQYRSVIAKIDKEDEVKEITANVKVDLLFDKPVVEENLDEVYIFSGRSTIYVNKSLGVWGMSTVNSNEINTYDKRIGKAIAYYNAFVERME